MNRKSDQDLENCFMDSTPASPEVHGTT